MFTTRSLSEAQTKVYLKEIGLVCPSINRPIHEIQGPVWYVIDDEVKELRYGNMSIKPSVVRIAEPHSLEPTDGFDIPSVIIRRRGRTTYYALFDDGSLVEVAESNSDEPKRATRANLLIHPNLTNLL